MQVVELSGEHPNLPAAEVLGALRAWKVSPAAVHHEPRFLAFRPGVAPGRLAARLALARSVGTALLSGGLEEVAAGAGSVDLGGARFRLRVVDFSGEAPAGLEASVGETLTRRGRVDLETPEVNLRLLLSHHACLYRVEATVDRGAFEDRRAEPGPAARPVTLHPRLARALVNLTGVGEGETLLDPFCGAGGVLLEAALVGAAPLGADVQPDVLEACRATLRRFGLRGDLHAGDVGEVPEAFGVVDAIATDPPYGRSASTSGEDVEALLRRAFRAFEEVLRPGGRLAIALPAPDHLDLAGEGLRLRGFHALRVHRSLTRHFALFEKPR